MKIFVAGIDPAISNTGIVIGTLDAQTMQIDLTEAYLITTEKNQDKKIRRSSDDLSRAREMLRGLMTHLDGVEWAFVEVPAGTQNARSAMSNGITLGVLSSIDIPLFQVQPLETKKASVGRKDATKEDIIAWATKQFPNLPWIKGRGGAEFSPRNEHLADAAAIVYAGIQTAQFREFLAIWRKFSQS